MLWCATTKPGCMPSLHSKAEGAIINDPFSLFEAVSKYFNLLPYRLWVFLFHQSRLGSEVAGSIRPIKAFPTSRSHSMSKSV